MATMTETNENKNITSGILRPKFKHQFRVVFTDSHGQDILQTITQQVIRISGFEYPGTRTQPNYITIQIEDDLIGSAMNRVYDLIDSEESFNMILQLLDGNDTVVESFIFNPAQFISVSVSDYDYNTTAVKYITSFNNLDLLEADNDHNYFENVVIRIFKKLSKFTTLTEQQSKTNTCLVHHRVDIQYSNAAHVPYSPEVK
jgi:hypothetical protein